MQIDHTKNIIEVSDVSFSYGSHKILENINLNLHEGDYLGLIGPNGGGKTTLVKLMLGLLKPDKGKINMFGVPLSKFKDWNKIGYVAQKVTNFDPNFPITASEVVSLGKNSKEERKNVKWALEILEMQKFANRLIGQMSGGQQQRIFIARALAQKPKIIFLDEPTSGVDANSQEEFYKFIEKLNHELDITLILVSHDMEIVEKEVTEIAFVNQKLTYYNNPKEFVHQHEHS